MSVQASPRQPTWIEVAVRNAGMMKGATAITWAWCWGITREILKHDPSVEEVAEYWNASVRTAYRDHAAFKKAFPMLDSPAPYVRLRKQHQVSSQTHRCCGNEDWVRAVWRLGSSWH
jgi:hypothetical protein